MMVLGVDLALVRTGYAILDDGALVGSGVIVTTSRQPMSQRLLHIKESMGRLLSAQSIDLVGVETSETFQRRLADGAHSIDSLAMARAAVLIACAELNVKVVLVAPGHVRWLVCGSMTASKLDVVAALRARGFSLPLNKASEVDLDVSDALCVAVCVWCEQRLAARIGKEANYLSNGTISPPIVSIYRVEGAQMAGAAEEGKDGC